MCKYKTLLTKIETFHITALLSGNNCIFVEKTPVNVDIVLLSLSSCGQFCVNDTKTS